MDIYDKKNYEPGSPNAVRLEERIRRAGAWPEDPRKAQKMLRRQLEILRNGDMAEDKAITLLINRKDDETVRLRYLRNRAPRQCQDLGIFDWPTRELGIEEIRERLLSAGIGYRNLDEEFDTVRENARKKILQLNTRYERREKEYNKRKKLETLIELKYQTLLKKVEQAHGIKLEYYIGHINPAVIRIVWPVSSPSTIWSYDLHFSIYEEFLENSPRTFDSVIEDILRVVPLGKSMQRSLEKTGNHVLMENDGLHVMSGPRPHWHSPFFLADDDDHEVPVLEGEDVELAGKLHDRVKELGLKIHTPRFSSSYL